MGTAKDLFITGLKNAHAMENQAHEMLERQAERMTDYPELRQRVTEHLKETKEQLARLEKCLADLDSSPSTIKDATLAFGANIAAMGHAMAGDEVLKNTFASSALEHYEIAAYKSLLALADHAGMRMKTVLEESLREEERMAQWMDKHVQPITLEFLRHEEKAAA
jgi:ferritin-like metal-binding protein YciE